jgi:diguanylate cyclase (GGDEF)-like protein
VQSLRILLIEDSEADALLLVLELERGGYTLVYKRVDTLTDLDTALQTEAWDLVLADYTLPGFTAIDALALMQQQQLDLPFIVVSGCIGEETAVAAMKSGAHDYLLKNNLARLVPTIEREIREARVRAERKQAFETIRYLAFYDVLTGLANRTMFLSELQQILGYVHNPSPSDGISSTYDFAVLLVDVDRYKTIKHSLGHQVGETFLQAIAKKLETCLQPEDLLARVGTDEFAILLRSLGRESNESVDRLDEDALLALCAQIHQNMSIPFESDGLTIFSTCSIGVVRSDQKYTSAEDYLQAADTAKHYAKLSHRGCTRFFLDAMQTQVINRLELEVDLQQALQQRNGYSVTEVSSPTTALANSGPSTPSLYLQYQPIINLQDEQIAALEALSRWEHPRRGYVSPAEFIPLAEETGLILTLGRWVFEEACQQIQRWRTQFPMRQLPRVSINLSTKQLSYPGLVEELDNLLEVLDLDGTCLDLEITESVLMENATSVASLLAQLRDRQIRIYVDDFGTGYSSLSYLASLPIDVLKIDRAFIHQMESCDRHLGIVRTILTLAENLGLEVVAEGIETTNQLEILRTLGCQYGQGFLFSPSQSADALFG